MNLKEYYKHQIRNCDCKNYTDAEYKEIDNGRTIVRVETCHVCFRVLSRTYFKKQKTKRTPRGITHEKFMRELRKRDRNNGGE